MAMRSYELVIGILAVWRVTHLFNAEDGPWDLLVRLRSKVGSGHWGSLLDCFYCLSLWVAVPVGVLLGETWKFRVLLWLALSGGACLLERLTAKKPALPVAQFFEEDERNQDALLRKEEGSVFRDGQKFRSN